MPCVFCGGSEGGITPEHVLPDWIKRVVPREDATGVYESPAVATTRRRLPALYNEQVKVVCQNRCNGGWMSQLETRTKPILTPLIQGHRAELSEADCETLGIWAAKTAFMACFLRPQLPVPPDYGPRFYQDKKPPPATVVWVARHEMGRQVQSARRASIRFDWIPQALFSQPVAPKDATGYSVTLSVRYFAFRVVVFGEPPFRRPVRLNVELDASTPGVAAIWPAAGALPWPPGPSLDNVGLSVFGTALLSGEGRVR